MLNTLLMLRAVIIGAPGCGKGTISNRICEHFNIKHISTGDILRANIAQNTSLGIKAKEYMNKGLLVPDELMIDLVKNEVEDLDCNYLLDGFPRTHEQALGLWKHHISPNCVIHVNVPKHVIVDRLSKRWIHAPSGRVYNLDFNAPKKHGHDDVTGEKLIQRDDDKPEAITKRLETFDETIKPLLEYYDNREVLDTFSGNTTNEIWPRIYEHLNMRIPPLKRLEPTPKKSN
uniref:GTP:AMP phosphotransferase, mitochondrial n=1 Tax=Cacopsylla melanoneura TaxID=428564 RepID=A0A8D8ZLA3_9HEMI